MKCRIDGKEFRPKRDQTPFKMALQHLIEDHPSLVAEYLYETHFKAAMDTLLRFSQASEPANSFTLTA